MSNSSLIYPQELCSLFQPQRIRSGKALEQLNSLHGLSGLCQRIQTSKTSGLPLDPPLEFRAYLFGDNYPHQYKLRSIWHFIWQNLKDAILQILILAAIISLIIGMAQNTSDGWLQGAAILSAVTIVVAVSAVNDYMKELQFIKLNLQTETHTVVVTRAGKKMEIPERLLLVGDLMEVFPGEIMPVDGVLVKGSGFLVDESSITGESDLVRKDALRAGDVDIDPFLVSGSTVTDGSGQVIVCCVGKYSVQGKNKILSDNVEQEQETPLQERLVVIAEGLGKVGFIAGALLSMVLLGHTLFDAIVVQTWTENDWTDCITAVILGITILVVAIPEGLPLALTLSMAYSILQMKKENIFVRHLKGCEIMGSATSICSDKTGTLTQNKMSVAKAFFGTVEVNLNSPSLAVSEKRLIAGAISRNTTVFIQRDEFGNKKTIGNKTEGALIELVEKWGFEYSLFRKPQELIIQYPFTGNAKRMSTVCDLPDGIWVFTKGAPEVIIERSSKIHFQSSPVSWTSQLKQKVFSDLQQMTSQSLRTLAIAYKKTNQKSIDSRESTEKDLVFLGLVGIEDPLRSESHYSVTKCQESGVIVRMLTGDSLPTATKIAKSCRILQPDLTDQELQDFIMEGAQFRSRVGGLAPNYDTQGKVVNFQVGNLQAFREIKENLRVIARCTPEDKLLLVTGLKQVGEVVGVTGDGSNDAAALKQSDIGLAMMSGTPLAKECADIILLDDNFQSVLNSIKWGRNVYCSIRKFLQFQITVNIVALVVSITGALTVQDSPLTAVQMLWVNLIMDSLAALALATEPPTNTLFKTRPFGRTEPIVSSDMYVTIVSQALYQILVLFGMLYLAPSVLEIQSGWGNQEWTQENGIHFTLLFNTFVMMQVFNQINCRKLEVREWNVFEGFFRNWMFVAILAFTVIVQYSFVEFGGELLECSSLSLKLHFVCVLLGFGGLLVGLIVRMSFYSVWKKPYLKKEEIPLVK